jgi:hypothetical protein
MSEFEEMPAAEDVQDVEVYETIDEVYETFNEPVLEESVNEMVLVESVTETEMEMEMTLPDPESFEEDALT